MPSFKFVPYIKKFKKHKRMLPFEDRSATKEYTIFVIYVFFFIFKEFRNPYCHILSLFPH